MARVLQYCETCAKAGKKVVAEVKSDMRLGKLTIATLKCGHTKTTIGVSQGVEDTLDITSLDGKRPFKYQLEGGQFLERANGRALVADEMGLGKTVQAEIFLKAHKECLPAAVFCKSGLRLQWNKESVRWGDFMCQVVDGAQNVFFIPGMDLYIISLDSAWRIGKKAVKVHIPGQKKAEIVYEDIPGKSLPEELKRLGVKTIIIDECQLIKNDDSKRTKAIQDCCRDMEHVIALSGTPIKNNAAEYFPILNILRPDKFPSKKNFVYGWCDTYHDGYKAKTGGLRDAEKFLEFTKDFIIRRERKQVLPDLPSIFRQFSFCDLGEMVEEEYKRTQREFNEFFDEGGSGMSAMEYQGGILAFLSKMRHLTGLCKIDPVCEYVEEFITTTDRKLMIFVHHQDVGQIIKQKLSKMAAEWPAEWDKGVLEITSSMDAQAREDAVDKFRSSDYRILIGSTLASGEGLNLQFCSDCIMMERQWNPANEEQAEARFPRPGQTADKINATYFIAVGTVDEFFSELVEKKREIVAGTLSGKSVAWDQTSLVKELAETLRQRGGQRWGW